jgi:drug/metabolite transporter (DMT)-like permease
LLACVAGVLEVGYFSLLTAAYRRGDVSVVYPIARGTAPLLSVLIGVAILGERLGWGGSIGVAALLCGLMAIRRPWQFFRRSVREANPRLTEAAALAFGTGAMIASYSAVDRQGARVTEPWIYAAILSVTVMVGLWVRVLIGRRIPPIRVREMAPPTSTVPEDPAPGRGDHWVTAGVVGLLSYMGYALILFAYNHAPLTAVAPLRESAVVFASGWGTLKLGEGGSVAEAVWRVSGALVVVSGIFLLALDGG